MKAKKSASAKSAKKRLALKRRRLSPAEELESVSHKMVAELFADGPRPSEAPAGTIVLVLFHDPKSGAARWGVHSVISNDVCGRHGVAESILQAGKKLLANAKRLELRDKAPIH